MDYTEMFLRTEKPRKLSKLEALALNFSMLSKLGEEGFSPRYDHKLTQDYYSEDKLLTWMDMLSQTPGYKWFKSRYKPALHNLGNIPEKEGAMLVSNHNTMFFADVAPIYLGVYEKKRRIAYGMGHKLLKDSDVMKTIGGTWGRSEVGVKMLQEDKLVFVCPEGALGAARSKVHAYHVRPIQGFSFDGMGYLEVAYKADKPIIPIGSVGGEENCLVLANIKPEVESFFNKLEDKLHISSNFIGRKCFEWIEGTKVIPLLAAPPFPLKTDAYVGGPIDVRKFVDKRERKVDYFRANIEVMQSIQDLIDKGLEKRSKHLLKFYKYIRYFSKQMDLGNMVH